MRLYKMELYKLISRKIFIVGAIGMIGIILFTWLSYVLDERATVDGVTYTGFQAVQVNRQITEEFKGILTDEKVEQIVEKYGFPQKVETGWGYFRDANFLNQFVLNYLSDGYIYHWEDYKIATVTFPIAETVLGEVEEFTGKGIELEYYRGWEVFLETMSVGMILGSILILFSISVIYANEGQIKMLPLLFTTKEGREKDIYAKIAAAYTITVVIWITIVFFDLLLCGIVFGFDGLDNYNGMVVSFPFPVMENLTPMYVYIAKALLLNFFGMLFLCSITLCISACYKSSFHAVVVAAICWVGIPFLIMMFTDGYKGNFVYLLSVTPVFMAIYRTLDNIYPIWLMPAVVTSIASILCAARSYGIYKRQQIV